MAEMTEAELDRGVRRILKDLPTVLGYHTHDSRRSHSGYPDWTFVGPRGVMWRELKTAKGMPSPAQNRWIDALRLIGDSDLWRPADLLSGRIARELATLAGMVVATKDLR